MHIAHTDSCHRPHFYYDSKMEKSLRSVCAICDEIRALIKENYTSKVRLQTVSVRILEQAMNMIEMIYCAFAERYIGNDEKAREIYQKARIELGKWERGHERYYNHSPYMSIFRDRFLDDITDKQKNVDLTDVMYNF